MVLEDGPLGLLHVQEQLGHALVLRFLLQLLQTGEVVLGEALVVVPGLLAAGQTDVVLQLHRRLLPRHLLVGEYLRVLGAQSLALAWLAQAFLPPEGELLLLFKGQLHALLVVLLELGDLIFVQLLVQVLLHTRDVV